MHGDDLKSLSLERIDKVDHASSGYAEDCLGFLPDALCDEVGGFQMKFTAFGLSRYSATNLLQASSLHDPEHSLRESNFSLK